MQAASVNAEIPAHVPPELVRPFSHMASEGMLPAPGACPYRTLQQLYRGPRIFYSPPLGRMLEGNWVLTRNEDIRYVLTHADIFSSKGIAGFSHLLGESWDMIPLEVDPPDHTRYRQFLGPLFSPGRVNTLEASIAQSCSSLIDDIIRKDSCEFIEDFARRFPVRIFMTLLGLPLSDYEQILAWEEKILHSPDIAVRAEGARAIASYLQDLLQQRSVHPCDDLLTLIASADVSGARLTATEQLSVSLFLFVAGLDTVASALGYIFRYLAEHPQQQTWLREDASRLPAAVEELLRAYAVVITSRRVTRDVEVGGVRMKAGDSVSVPLALANYDSDAIDSASELQLARHPNRHLTFSSGPHHCLGAHLARKEIITAVSQWLQRLPNFRVQEGTQPIARGGAVFGVDLLHLDWDRLPA